ncbi:hypothetical protein G3I59_06060 [Amycolatopsis rubida]|uniref:Uncharacterized protein n=1 Tax=Amycolatopsis rubida TaxID=112413 RepID=A0ABX0BP96_9PSEU|nr:MULTISPECIES: hypothetical protein [Amycolatopsis]MYW90195.1 hypothetical protein [Amycolatopsis rubida]NEC55172.1 hypothetical protein [Amycolatopsis rubida]OAP28541.1 hypothetical protein A4R44_00331 [Amycolatopsis sp. M39]
MLKAVGASVAVSEAALDDLLGRRWYEDYGDGARGDAAGVPFARRGQNDQEYVLVDQAVGAIEQILREVEDRFCASGSRQFEYVPVPGIEGQMLDIVTRVGVTN